MVIIFLSELQLGRAFKQSNIPLDIGKQWAEKYPHDILFIVLQSVKWTKKTTDIFWTNF